MFPFSSIHSNSFKFCITKFNQNDPTPISDIESESKSVNGDLCESFEGLFKKEDHEESTRSSEWSEKQKNMACASKVDNDNQNQVEQKQNHSKNQGKQRIPKNFKLFSKSQWKPIAINLESVCSNQHQEQKIELQSIDQIKKSLQQKRNKLSKYRQKFLSLPCYIKLPEELLKMLQIAQKIDCYLAEKKSAQYTDNVYNIFKTVFSDEQMSTIWSTVKKIMLIGDNHYRIRIDPLKNLCISFVHKKDNKPQVRKQKLRKLMGQYYFNNKNTFTQQGVAEAYIEPVKTSRFYPENLNLCPQMHGKKVSKKYVTKLEESVKNKQAKIQEIQEKCESCAPATPQSQGVHLLPHHLQLEQFCDAISKIYSQKKVLHMYKSTLIEQVRNNTTFSLDNIFFLIKYITQEELFLEVIIKSGCKIFGLIEKEKSSLIEILKTRKGE